MDHRKKLRDARCIKCAATVWTVWFNYEISLVLVLLLLSYLSCWKDVSTMLYDVAVEIRQFFAWRYSESDLVFLKKNRLISVLYLWRTVSWSSPASFMMDCTLCMEFWGLRCQWSLRMICCWMLATATISTVIFQDQTYGMRRMARRGSHRYRTSQCQGIDWIASWSTKHKSVLSVRSLWDDLVLMSYDYEFDKWCVLSS